MAILVHSTNAGRIATRHRGGGHKKRVRVVDFNRFGPGPHQILRFEYDPNRSGELCLLRNQSTNEFSYILRPADVKLNDVIYSYRSGVPVSVDSFSKGSMLQPGNCLMLKDIPVGTQIHNISLRPDGPGQLCRSAGTSAQLLATSAEGYAQIRLSSREIRLIPVNACATIGSGKII